MSKADNDIKSLAKIFAADGTEIMLPGNIPGEWKLTGSLKIKVLIQVKNRNADAIIQKNRTIIQAGILFLK